MKLRQLFEMPERIQQEEVNMPWQSADTSKKIWAVKLRDVPGGMLACHPLKRPSQRQFMVIAYMKTERGYEGASAMLVNVSRESGREIYAIDGLSTKENFRGRGIAYAMYTTMAFDKHLTVISDDVQTDGGAAMWNKLSRTFPDNVGVFEDELEDVVAVSDWKDGNPFTHPFTRLVLSPTRFEKQKQAA